MPTLRVRFQRSVSLRSAVDFKAVKAAVSMLQVLEHYGFAASFKRSGNSLSGPCPLHGGENRTQFRVSLEKNCWNCFGTCKGGGNVLLFVARTAAVRQEVPLPAPPGGKSQDMNSCRFGEGLLFLVEGQEASAPTSMAMAT